MTNSTFLNQLTSYKELRILSNPAADTPRKLEILESLKSQNELNHLTVDALINSLEDEEIRIHAVEVLIQLLHQLPKADDRHLIMSALMDRVFNRLHDDSSIPVRIFETLVNGIEKHLPESDYLLAWLIQEVTTIESIPYYHPKIYELATDLFDRSFWPKGSQLDQLFEEIGHDRYFDALIDNYTDPHHLKPILQKLNTRNLKKISLNLIMAHIAPILNRTYVKKGIPNVAKFALKNLIKWSKEFPSSIEDINQQRIKLAEWSEQQSEFNWENPLMKQLAMNALMTEPLLDVLTDKRNNQNCDKALLFGLLSRLQAMRQKDNMQDVCDYVRKNIKERDRAFPYAAAIDFLEVHLTSYDLHQPLRQEALDKLTGRTFENSLLKERNLKPDQLIKGLLLELSFSEILNEADRIHAFSTLVFARPPELVTIIEENLVKIVKSETFLRSALKNIGAVNFLPAFHLLQELWKQKDNYSEETQLQLIDSLGHLGNREILGEFTKDEKTGAMIPSFLLQAAFEDKSSAVREKIISVFARENYRAEYHREQHRRRIFTSIEKEKAEGEGIAKNENGLQNTRLNIQQKQNEYNTSAFQLDQAVSRQDTFTLGAKIDLGIISTDTAKLRRFIEIVLKEVARHEKALEQTVRKLNEKVAAAKKIAKEVERCENRLANKEQQLQDATRKREQLQRDTERWQRESNQVSRNIADLERRHRSEVSNNDQLGSRYNQINNQRNRLQQKKRQYEKDLRRLDPDNSGQINRYKSNIASTKRELRSVESTLSSAEADYKRAKRNLKQLDRELSGQRSTKKSLENKISSARNSINRLEQAIPEYKRAIQELERSLNNLKSQLHHLNSDIEKYRITRQQQRQELDQIRAELVRLRERFRQLQQQQEEVLRNSRKGMERYRLEIDQLNSLNAKIIGKMDQLRNNIPAIEKNIQTHKTNKQTLVQQIEDSREHYDELGDLTHQETSEADARNRQRSEHQRELAQGKGREKILMDLRVKRSSDLYRGRNQETTKKFQNKISKKS